MQVLCDLQNCRSGYFREAKNGTDISKVNSKLFRKPVKRYASPFTLFFYNLLRGGNWHGKGNYKSETDTCQEGMVGMQHDLYHIGDRIRELRRTLGLTQKEFSEKIGLSRSRVAEIEAGEPTKESVLIAISRTFKVSLEWLKHGTGEMFLPKEELIPTELVAIPVITEAGAGVRYTPDHVLVERSRLKHYKVEAFKVVGDSMMPTIQEGEYVLIDRQDTLPYDNAIYLIACQENGIRIRRLRYISGQWWAFADNPKYAPELYSESCKIIGRVVAVYKPAEVKNL